MGALQSLLSMMVSSAGLIVLVVGGALAFAALVRFERSDRPQVAVGMVFVVLVLELFLYPSQNDIPGLPFRLYVFGQSFRLIEIVILVALLARLSVRGFPSRYSVTGLAWGLLLLWWTASFVVGLLHGNSLDLVVFQFNMVIYLGGAMTLAASVPVERYIEHRSMGRWAVLLGLMLAVSVAPTLSLAPLFVDAAFAPGSRAGFISADMATLAVGIAVVILLVENAKGNRRRMPVTLLALLMLVCPLFQGQRGALVGLAVTVIVLVGVSCTSVWRRRIATTYTEAVLFVALALVPFVGNSVWKAMDTSRPPVVTAEALPKVVGSVEESFTSTGKQQSAETRQNLWRDGLGRFAERPLVGSGLGTEYEVKRAGTDEALVGGGFHNIVVDVMVRTGVVGLVLLSLALIATVAAGLRLWRRHPDPRVASFGLGLLLALANLLAKGMVESVFEKYRLAVLGGLLLGAMLSASRPTKQTGSPSRTEVSDYETLPVVRV